MQRRQFLQQIICKSTTIAAPLLMTNNLFAINKNVEHLPDDVILLSAPSSKNDYYDETWDDLVKFYLSLVKNAHKKDQFLIVADRSVRRELVKEGLPNENLLLGTLPDIWCRDLCTVITPKMNVNFSYKPSYLQRGDATYFEKRFDRFLSKRGVKWKRSQLVLDGGNYCHNGIDSAVVCGRVLSENKIDAQQLTEALTPLTGSTKIAILPTEEGDTLGHADGMVSWLTPSILAVNEYEGEMRVPVMKELKRVFPNVAIVELPYEPTDRIWKGIADASGVYTNILHTKNAAYISAFGNRTDKVAQQLIDKHCPRTVIPVDVGKVTRMGGGIRCFSWQNRVKAKKPLPL